jgi:hypothetical protein
MQAHCWQFFLLLTLDFEIGDSCYTQISDKFIDRFPER